MPSTADTKVVSDFNQKHCIKRTYFFQVKKYSDQQCTFHEPLTSEQEISDFPDPIPYEENGIEHYKMGSDSVEKCMQSLLLDSSKRPHNNPFSPMAQRAKNVGLTVKGVECKEPRV